MTALQQCQAAKVCHAKHDEQLVRKGFFLLEYLAIDVLPLDLRRLLFLAEHV